MRKYEENMFSINGSRVNWIWKKVYLLTLHHTQNWSDALDVKDKIVKLLKLNFHELCVGRYLLNRTQKAMNIKM